MQSFAKKIQVSDNFWKMNVSQINAAAIAAKRDAGGGPRPQEVSELQFPAPAAPTTAVPRVRLRHSQGNFRKCYRF